MKVRFDQSAVAIFVSAVLGDLDQPFAILPRVVES
jgi:hypothetical protein